ncbi:MAG: hypothetical protein WAU70_01685, partial [Flavobacteriales bacterium]
MKSRNSSASPLQRTARWWKLTMLCSAFALAGTAHAQNVNVSGCTGAGNVVGAPTLGAAIAGIALAQPGANIVIDIVGSTTEGVGTITIGAGSWTSMLIRPQGGAWTVGAATTAGLPMIDLNGADNVTIDGLNSPPNALTIQNTSTGGSGTCTVRFIADATSNIIRNCTVNGSSLATLGTNGGTIFFSTGVATGNDGNTIQGCNIGPASATLPFKAIYSSGSAGVLANSGVLIDNNNIFDFFGTGASSTSGINLVGGSDLWTIQNNRIYQTGTRTFTTTALRYAGITLSNSAGSFIVTGNTIGFGAANGTGTTTITGSSNEVRGIDAPSTSTTVATSIQNNTISGINQTSSRATTTSGSSCFIGIVVGTTGGRFNIGDITGNKIGSLDGSSTIVVASTATVATAPVIGIYDFSFQSNLINNNQIGSITINNGGVGTTCGFRGILVSGTAGVTTTTSGNTIGGTAAGSITDNIVGVYAMYAIQYGTANATCTGNIIRNMTGNSTTASGIVSSAFVSTASAGVNVVSQNTVHSLLNNSGSASNSIYAIYCGFAATANIVERNFVHSLNITSTAVTSQLVGILPVSGTGTYKNNMVRLGVDASGASITGGFQIYGMFQIAGLSNIYHNSVYVGGSGVTSGASTTFAFVSNVTSGAREYQDNIFWNARSNGAATGKHYAIALSGSGILSNYNDLYANGTGGFVGLFGGVDQTSIAAWRTASGQDANSLSNNPNFANPTGTAALVDLHMANPTVVEGTGLAIASVLDDYDGQTRSGLTPTDMGADAGTFVPADLAAPSITLNAVTDRCNLSGGTITAVLTDATGVDNSASLRPRLYFYKNVGPFTLGQSVQGTLGPGTVFNGTWTFVFNAAAMGGIAPGDVISYFVIAQDVAGTPNIGSNPGAGLVATDVNSISTYPTTPLTYTVGTTLAAGVYTIPTMYASLTAAVADYNTRCLAGAVVFEIEASYTGVGETYPITINSNVDASAINTLTIRPAAGASPFIAASSTTTVLRLNGADWVTIEGSNAPVANACCSAPSSRNLTIANTGITAGSGVVWLASAASNGVTNCTIRNCNIFGNAATTTLIALGSGGATVGSTALAPNDNVTYENNEIRGAQIGITAQGMSAASKNQNNVISMNVLTAAAPNNCGVGGIVAHYQNNLTVSCNQVDNMGTDAFATDAFAINVGMGFGDGAHNSTAAGIPDATTNVTISKNTIGNVVKANSWGATGISFGNSISGTSTIANNMIYGVNANGTAGDISGGILLAGGTGGTTRVYYNTVSMRGTIAGADPADQTSACLMVTQAAMGTLDVKNNIFSNTQIGNAGATLRLASIALTAASFGGFTSDFNDLYSAGAAPGTHVVGITGGVVLGTSRAFPGAGPTDWTTITGQDANSNNALPLFLSPTNLHLQTATASNNANLDSQGTPVAVTDDIDCDTRTGVDIGADEYIALPPCQPEANAPVVVPNCTLQQFSIDVDVTSTGTSALGQIDIATDYLGDVEPQNVGTGIVTVGPFPSGTSVIITLVHSSGPPCDLVLDAVSFTCPPVNDLCADAILIDCNSITLGTTTAATADPEALALCATSSGAPGVWYTVVGEGGNMLASLCGSSYDTKIHIYTGTCAGFTCIAGNDDIVGCAPANLGSEASWLSTQGTVYTIHVFGFGAGDQGAFSLQVICNGQDNPPCVDNGVALDIHTDMAAADISWEILAVGTTIPQCTGSGYSDD